MPEQKAIPAAPHVTAVVVKSGDYEATIGNDQGIVITRVGPRGGRTVEIVLSASEARNLLALVEHGRAVLEGMQK